MKKFLFGLLCFSFLLNTADAQEDPAKLVKKAAKALQSYNLDPSNNTDKLNEAKTEIDAAVKADVNQNSFEAWQKRGEIYNALCNSESGAAQLAQLSGKAYEFKNADAALVAKSSFEKALGLAVKKFETKDAINGLKETVGYLNSYSNQMLNKSDYKKAFELVDAVLSLRDLLVQKGEKDIFDKETDLYNHQFVVAFCAAAAGNNARAKAINASLLAKGIDMLDPKSQPTVYANQFRILAEEKDPGALKVLEAGRAKFPDDKEILFAEINYYISLDKYDVLEVKLKEAIAKEPNNPSIFSALGNVYMNLHTKEMEANSKEKADGYFDQALEYFNKALAINPKLFDANYSIGSLYFNKAVEIFKAMNKLGTTKEDQKKYDAMKKDAEKLFDQALPYFKKSEAMDPNDTNTLIALKEIFARKNDFATSGEFKKRLETVTGGGQNNKPYFNE